MVADRRYRTRSGSRASLAAHTRERRPHSARADDPGRQFRYLELCRLQGPGV